MLVSYPLIKLALLLYLVCCSAMAGALGVLVWQERRRRGGSAGSTPPPSQSRIRH